ncbi:2-oxoacid:acceptor oxidoreductase subunit alpha, partial [Candidatus Aerophobetes bacterium]
MVSRLADTDDYVSIVLAGEAGQGIQTVEHILARVLKLSGYNVFSSKEYMSRIRGGTNSTEIRISSRRVSSFVDRIDILTPLSEGALQHLGERVSSETMILGDRENLQREYRGREDKIMDVPFSQVASDVGSKIYSNTVAVGVLSGLFKVEINILEDYLREHFSAKGEKVVRKNIKAARKGYEIGADLVASGKIEVKIEKNFKVTDEVLVNGAEAVALGAIGGGCNFVSFYPMSPSTPVAVFMAQHSRDFDI